MNYLIKLEETVLCPVCQECKMREKEGHIYCEKCGVEIRTNITLNDFETIIESKIIDHGEICKAKLIFNFEGNQNHKRLSAFCKNCGSCCNVF